MMTSDEFRQPTHLPVRMLNEYVYCPRLFHIEWAEARWAENDDTTAGSLSHRWITAADACPIQTMTNHPL